MSDDTQTDHYIARVLRRRSGRDKRERLERLTVTAINNRIVAAAPALQLRRLKDRQLFKERVAFWGDRIACLRDALDATGKGALWAEHASTLSRLRALIETEFRRRRPHRHANQTTEETR